MSTVLRWNYLFIIFLVSFKLSELLHIKRSVMYFLVESEKERKRHLAASSAQSWLETGRGRTPSASCSASWWAAVWPQGDAASAPRSPSAATALCPGAPPSSPPFPRPAPWTPAGLRPLPAAPYDPGPSPASSAWCPAWRVRKRRKIKGES